MSKPKQSPTPAQVEDDGDEGTVGATAPTTIRLNDTVIALTALPAQSLVALAQRGANHVMKSEAASRVLSLTRKAAGLKPDDKAGLEAYREANPEAVDAIEAEVAAYFIAKIREGRLGVPEFAQGNGFEAAVRALAWKEVAARLEAASPGCIPRKVSEPVRMADGDKTRAELVDVWLAKPDRRERIEAAVKAERAARAAAAKAKPASGGVAPSLGDIL